MAGLYCGRRHHSPLKKEDHVMRQLFGFTAIALVGGYGIYLGNAGHSLMEGQ